MDAGLTVGERIVLLGLDEADGTPREQLRVGCAVAAAPLLDLVRSGRVVARDGGLALTEEPPDDEPLAAAVAAQMRRAPDAKPQAWLLAVRDEAVTAAYEGLLAKGVVRQEGRKRLGVFGSHRYPPADPAVLSALRAELSAVLLANAEPAPDTAELLTLLHRAGLDALALPDADPARIAPRMAEVSAALEPDGTVGDAVSAALAAVTVLLASIPGLTG
ncbi:GPP34 family phosphoprotein [Streptomyces sp. NEAU-sy36]|uniref:GOLPH3/VPS74 family protein n=1 Tax=unclassified Streptomyces TaxID=2593676 RepID=UPI0015D60EE4|nr:MULTISPECIES: GPP34 family phosphoprotein [unclassified Streptomyces]QLJ05139.1 GPP34 family phosphoprotein [Streptomyces sp. NEAU-sy36]